MRQLTSPWTTRRGVRLPLVAIVATAGLVLAGCADGGNDEPTDGTQQTTTDDGTTNGAADDGAADDGADDATTDDAAADGGGQADGRGQATITFDDGESLSTEVFCMLEPQPDATGGQILYTATSMDNPYFDLTVFADDDGTVTDTSVSWDVTEDFETYQESWAAGGFGGDFEVALDGTTITGGGTFVRGLDESDQEGEMRQADVTVECG